MNSNEEVESTEEYDFVDHSEDYWREYDKLIERKRQELEHLLRLIIPDAGVVEILRHDDPMFVDDGCIFRADTPISTLYAKLVEGDRLVYTSIKKELRFYETITEALA